MSSRHLLDTSLVTRSRNHYADNIMSDVFDLLMKFENFSLVNRALPVFAFDRYSVTHAYFGELIIHINFIAVAGSHLEGCASRYLCFFSA